MKFVYNLVCGLIIFVDSAAGGVLILPLREFPTTIDVQGLACSEFGSIGHEVDGRTIQIFGPAIAASIQGLFGFDKTQNDLIFAGPLRHGCFHEGRGQEIDPNVVGSVIGGNGFGKTNHG